MLTLHATRPTPHGASRLVQAMSAWSVKTRRAPPRHCRDARVYGHTTTAMYDNECTPPPPSLSLFCFLHCFITDCRQNPFPMFIAMVSRRLESGRFFANDFHANGTMRELDQSNVAIAAVLVSTCSLMYSYICVCTPPYNGLHENFLVVNGTLCCPACCCHAVAPAKGVPPRGLRSRVQHGGDSGSPPPPLPAHLQQVSKGQSAFKPWGVQS